MPAEPRIYKLADLKPGAQADCFVLLSAKDRATTRDGKPYYRVTFRDAARSAVAMVWSDSPWFEGCDGTWKVGSCYKLRCRYVESSYGPQLELERLRLVEEADRRDGFDETALVKSTRFNIESMFAELLTIARTKIEPEPLRQLVVGILEEHADAIRRAPAAKQNHHAYIGGFLEHVLSVTRNATFLADKYAADYPTMQPPLSKSLVVAGAILHDIGKLIELEFSMEGARRTAEGELIGHILLGRDMVRERGKKHRRARPRDALAARAYHRRPPEPARMGLAHRAAHAGGAVGLFRRRRRRQVPHAGRFVGGRFNR